MSDFLDRVRDTVMFAVAVAVAMAVLVTVVALVLGTTGHDWYAAGKFTLAEAMIAVGFDDLELIEYRTGDDATRSVTRYSLMLGGGAWWARRCILSMIADRAMLGACTGLAIAVLWLGARGTARLLRRGRVAEVQPPPGPYRPPEAWGAGGRIAGYLRPGGGRARIGLLVVSADEFESLIEHDGTIEFVGSTAARTAQAGAGPAGRSGPDRAALPTARAPALPPAGCTSRATTSTVPCASAQWAPMRKLLAVAAAGCLSTATRGSQSSDTTSGDTTHVVPEAQTTASKPVLGACSTIFSAAST